MIIIADTSPLNYLILIDAIDILPRLYDHVIIPVAVQKELQARETPIQVRNWLSQAPAWLDIRVVASQSDPALDYVGAGEREALSLAIELQADALIIDDRDGRKEAIARNMKVIGTIGVLAVAAEQGLIDLAQAISRLEKTSFRIAPALLRTLLDRKV